MEILPAALAWTTLIALGVLSMFLPVAVAVFIILFDLYWFLKTVYLALHLRLSFSAMRANLSIDWRVRLEENPNTTPRWKNLWHLVILPMYAEPYTVVSETFERLIQANYPLKKLIVVLATEERAGEGTQETARRITDVYKERFGHFIVTTHPADIEGELSGKGSNQAWAAKVVKKQLIDPVGIPYKNIIVSVFDVDTQVYPEYFGILTYKFLTAEKPLRSSFQPVPLFLNNIYQAPALARLIGFSSTFWHLMQQSRPERLTTFSSHAMPFRALVDIGFWQTHMVSEDSRIFWQCFIHYGGDWRAVPLLYPVSMDANAAPAFWQTLKNLYKQQRRWGWGAENIAYLLSGFRASNNIPSRTKRFWSFVVVEGFHSWATNALIIFALGWLPVIAGGSAFRTTVLAYNLPDVTRWIMTIASLGIVFSAVLSLMLLPPKSQRLKKINAVWYLISWILMPLTLIIFGSIPALEAQTRLALSGKWRLDFWVTPKHR
jgi:cellulose synthase/poly-beta-1,6-N-acetylglucosamine synthase-like glycosyltransferase